MADVRIFDAFLFSEPHETELLLAKLHVESELVETWVVVENAFTSKGAPKDLHLDRILAADRRFDAFRDRLHVVSVRRNGYAEFRRSRRERTELRIREVLPGVDAGSFRIRYDEAPNWFAERLQRDAALPVIRALAGGDGSVWVIATDCDEFLDASNPVRRDALLRAIRSGARTVSMGRQRFNYDVDNLCGAMRDVHGARLDLLVDRGWGIDDLRKRSGGLAVGPGPCVVEYSYCFSRSHVERKLATYPHTAGGLHLLERGLECNHAPVPMTPTWIDPSLWYQRVDPEAAGAPTYVLAHLEELRTGIVNPDYEEARRRRYPALFLG